MSLVVLGRQDFVENSDQHLLEVLGTLLSSFEHLSEHGPHFAHLKLDVSVFGTMGKTLQVGLFVPSLLLGLEQPQVGGVGEGVD